MRVDEKGDSFQKIKDLLEYLCGVAPSSQVSVIFRGVEPFGVINDAMEEAELPVEEEAEETPLPGDIELSSSFRNFEIGEVLDVAAVDSGIVRLGETEDGLFIALRGAIVVDAKEGGSTGYLFRTGPLFLPYARKVELLHLLGQNLIRPSLFVELDDSDPSNPRPTRLKRGVADTAHQYGDRFRNWFERMLQLMAATMVQNGIILIDGALTLRTRDTPDCFMKHLAERANDNGNALVAISKQSSLQVQDKTIQFWLDDYPNRAGYRWLTPLLIRERSERILGNLYAVRFTPCGPTFRMDVKSVEGQKDEETINGLYRSCLMRVGFPDILARAHAYSYFTASDVVQLQANIRACYRVMPRLEVDLAPILAPFGGRFR